MSLAPTRTVSTEHPETEVIARAAEAIRAGRLVAFPTETVYGLGANALDATAVKRIFEAKGRPASNPVIVHVNTIDEARQLTTAWPEVAAKLAAKFWPGPLSLVLPRAAMVPDVVTAGGPTVAIRVPSHPITRALIAAAGVPIAAPSANLATQISATRAEHVAQSLGDRVDLILDGGATPGGLESTVVDVTCDPPRLLRPGLLDVPTMVDALGVSIEVASPLAADDEAARSPGLQRRHYAPNVPLECVADDGRSRVEQLLAAGGRVGWIPLAGGVCLEHPRLVARPLPDDPAGYAQRLYATLHELQAAAVERIVLQLPPPTEAWRAIHDRLGRASVS